jgi:hypothetical protein
VAKSLNATRTVLEEPSAARGAGGVGEGLEKRKDEKEIENEKCAGETASQVIQLQAQWRLSLSNS